MAPSKSISEDLLPSPFAAGCCARRGKRSFLALQVLAVLLCLCFLSTHYKISVSRIATSIPKGPHCSFTKWVNLAVELPEEELEGKQACHSERHCQVALRNVCLKREPGAKNERQKLVVTSQEAEQCSEAAKQFSDIYDGCRRFGMNSALTFEKRSGEPTEAGAQRVSKPTILVNCVDMICDNWYHSINYVAYPTFMLMEQRGLVDLRGFSLRILAGAKGRELLTGLMENFNPDEILFSQLESGETQDLGCYDELYFMSWGTHPFQCDLHRDVRINPTLVKMVKLITSNMGFPDEPSLPEELSILHAKRTGERRILNPEDVEAAFKRPFQRVAVDGGGTWKMKFRQQIELHREASVLFGINGAGLTNLLFKPPGGVVIEVGNNGWEFQGYRNMAVQTGQYYMLIEVSKDANASAVVVPREGDFHNANLWVHPRDVERAMDVAEQLVHRSKAVVRYQV